MSTPCGWGTFCYPLLVYRLLTSIINSRQLFLPSSDMTPSPEADPANGHMPPPTLMSTEFDTGGHTSDSDVSEAHDVVVADPVARAPSSDPDEAPVLDDAGRDEYASEIEVQSDSTRDEASDDGDFDVDEAAPSPQSDGERDRSDPPSSRRSSARESPSEDTYIQQNPALYGLRRSVRQ